MDQLQDAETLATIAAEAFTALRDTRQIALFSSRPGGLTIDNAYRVTQANVRGARFKGAWPQDWFHQLHELDAVWVYAPVWGYVFNSTAYDLAAVETLSLEPFSEPRIEPEIIFGLGTAPSVEMNDTSLSSCIDWVGLGFEIVQSIFPGWKFSAADTVAANGVHGALLIGPRQPFAPRASEWLGNLSTFEIDLSCDGQVIDRGHSGNVLGGPLSSLRHLVELLARDPVNPPLAAGGIVSTGTLTKAMPIARGEVWTAKPTGIALEIRLRLA
jgi:2-keto-4-pentenoate hydratase